VRQRTACVGGGKERRNARLSRKGRKAKVGQKQLLQVRLEAGAGGYKNTQMVELGAKHRHAQRVDGIRRNRRQTTRTRSGCNSPHLA